MKEEKSKDTRRRRRKKSIANLKLVLSLRLTATLIFESTRARKKQVSNFLESSLQKKEEKRERGISPSVKLGIRIRVDEQGSREIGGRRRRKGQE